MTEIDPRDPRYQQQYPQYGQQQGGPVYATPVYGQQQGGPVYGQQQGGPVYGQQQYATPIYAQQAPGDQQTYVQGGYSSDAGAEKSRRTSVDPLTPVGGGSSGSKDGRFEYADGQYRDVCWLVLFLLHLIAMIVVAGVYGKKFVNDLKDEEVTTDSSSMSKQDQRTCIAIIAVSAIVGAVFGAVWLAVMKRCAESIIKISMILSTGILIFAIILSIAQGVIVMAVLYIIILILQSIYFFLVRNRIPFAQATLGASVQAIQDHSGPIYVAYLMAVVSVVWMLFWAFTFVSIFHATHVNEGNAQGNSDSSPSNGMNGLAYFALLVSLYWTTEVIKNIGHVTTAGVVATWWFNPMAESAVTCGAFKRATTTSLGSICFGSLIVALLQATRQILREASRQAQRDGNMAAAFLACCFECILSWIESMIRYFNMYAYTRVAIYGVDFITAAKETWQLFTNRGFEMLINDDLTGMVLMMGCFVGAVVTGLIGAFWAKMLDFSDWVVLGIIAFVIGYIMVALIMNVVESAVATTYVVWAEDPALCNQARPEHYTKLRDAAQRAYPSGQW